ncbi:g6058 [Coccomyxa elongata]
MAGTGQKHHMSKEAAARIQSATARKTGGEVPKGSFASRAQSAADRHEAEEITEAFDDVPDPMTAAAEADVDVAADIAKDAAATLESAETRQTGGVVEKGGHAARVQSAADSLAAEAAKGAGAT